MSNFDKCTTLEQTLLTAMINESIVCCGQFNDDENMSWFTMESASDVLGSINTVKGVFGSLMKKGLVGSDTDTGEVVFYVHAEDFKDKWTE